MFHWMEASTLHKTSIQNVWGIHAEKLKWLDQLSV